MVLRLMFRAFLKDSALYTLPAIVSRGLAIITIPIYTRALSTSDYGAFDLLMVFANLLNLTIALEVSQAVARFYAAEHDSLKRIGYASSAFWFTLLCYSIFAVLGFTFSEQLASLVMGVDGLEKCFQIGVLYIWFNGLFLLLQNQFRWELRSKHFAIVSLIVALTTAAIAIYLTLYKDLGLEGFMLGMLSGVIFGVIYSLWFLRHTFKAVFKLHLLLEMLRFSAPLVPSGIAVFLTTYIDRLMISRYLTLDDVGIYGIAFRLAAVIGVVMMGFQMALTPLIYSHYHKAETPIQLAKIFRVFTAFSLLVVMTLIVLADDILVLMTTPDYYGAASLMIFMVPAFLLSQMYVFAPGMAITKKTYIILLLNVMAALISIVMNSILIPWLGLQGAAIANMLSYLALFSGCMYISQKLYFVPHSWFGILISTAFIFSCAIVIPTLVSGGLFKLLVLSVALLLGIIVFIATGLIRISELSQLRAIVIRKHQKI